MEKEKKELNVERVKKISKTVSVVLWMKQQKNGKKNHVCDDLKKKKEISIQSKWETRLQLVKVSIVLGTFRSSKTRVLLRK